MNTASLPSPTSNRRRWMALGVVCLAQLMIVLDTTIVNVALPAVQRDLHFTQGNLTWVVNAFLVTFGSFLLLAGLPPRPAEPDSSGLRREVTLVIDRSGSMRGEKLARLVGQMDVSPQSYGQLLRLLP